MYTPSDQRDEHPPGDLALDLQLPQVVQIDGQRVGASGAKAEIGGEAAKYALPAELRLGQARDRDIGECDEASPQAPVTEPSVRTKPASSAFAPPVQASRPLAGNARAVRRGGRCRWLGSGSRRLAGLRRRFGDRHTLGAALAKTLHDV